MVCVQSCSKRSGGWSRPATWTIAIFALAFTAGGPLARASAVPDHAPVAHRAGQRPPLRPKHKLTDQDILDQAQAAYVRGERQYAIDLATSVAEKGGELAGSAWRFIGLAACSVRAFRLATHAFVNLHVSDDQTALIRACQSNGLSFVNNEFVER